MAKVIVRYKMEIEVPEDFKNYWLTEDKEEMLAELICEPTDSYYIDDITVEEIKHV